MKTLAQKLKEDGLIDKLDDGFCYLFINGLGAFSAEDLRNIATEIDEMNARHAADIEAYFNAKPTPTTAFNCPVCGKEECSGFCDL